MSSKHHPECFDEETLEFIRAEKHRQRSGLRPPDLHPLGGRIESAQRPQRPDGDHLRLGHGETGRILHHLRNNIENPRNTILIVSWQAPDTLGRRLADREKEVKIFGEAYHVPGRGGRPSAGSRPMPGRISCWNMP